MAIKVSLWDFLSFRPHGHEGIKKAPDKRVQLELTAIGISPGSPSARSERETSPSVRCSVKTVRYLCRLQYLQPFLLRLSPIPGILPLKAESCVFFNHNTFSRLLPHFFTIVIIDHIQQANRFPAERQGRNCRS